ncbi:MULTISPECIES: FAD-dependent oxidoreductase [unclassified Nonomuraea]|uniref:NAD(P)/FAD-dependent oxidoreductase n=1 Tax=unclassified Nonomuraea TaxID=2593643 RepID=UPI00340ACCC4
MIRLDRLANVLGGYGVRLCGRPDSRSTRLRSVAMPDATDSRVPGDVLLAVGAASVTEAVRWAVAAQAAVVLVRAGADAEREASLAGASEGVAVMLVDPAVSWSQLAGVVYGLVLEGRETESGRGPTDLFALADSTPRQAQGLLRELRRLADAGQPVDHTVLDAGQVAEHVPLASGALRAGVRIDGQRYVDPGRFVHALGTAVMARGATVYAFEVADVRSDDRKAIVVSHHGTMLSADAVVPATGAWLPRLASRWGVRSPIRAGRGYSFTVPVNRSVPGPIHLQDVRVACTPYQGGLRVAGTMEFRDPDAPAVPARLEAIIASARPLLDGVRWDERTDVWVGPRPVTPDGRPLIGATRTPCVYVAGGHGMWGLAHGPATGRLLAEQITTGKQPAALREFDPLR